MPFELKPTRQARDQLVALKNDPSKAAIFKAVNKALIYLKIDPRHKSLNTHKYQTLSGPSGEEVFEAYAQNNTPGAYRIFFCYGAGVDKGNLIILAITPHP
jgi:hypothetical protein